LVEPIIFFVRETQHSVAYSVTADLAADVGIHLGDGSLLIGEGPSKGTYRYEVIGHAAEDQLYLIGNVIPIVSSAYDLQQPGIYLNRTLTWMSLRYHSKSVAQFKHDYLGLPSGKKTNASIPQMIRDDSQLMKCLARELLATDGVLGFYTASVSGPHKYARIQLKMTAGTVIEELAEFLQNELGMSASCRMNAGTSDRWGGAPQHILQINCSEDIDAWRNEIGFSNPSHISRLMTFELMGECPPSGTTRARLSFLSGCSPNLHCCSPIPRTAFVSMVDTMRRQFGYPRLKGDALVEQIGRVNRMLRLRSGRELPEIVNMRAAGEI